MAETRVVVEIQDDELNEKVKVYTRAEKVSFIENLDVSKCLEKSAVTREILEAYRNSQPPQFVNGDRDRKRVVKEIINIAMGVDPCLTILDIQVLVNSICDTFKGEDPLIYFMRKAKGYGGLMFHYYKNERSKISGIRKAAAAFNDHAELPPVEPSVQQSKEFLDSNLCDQWDKIEEAWSKTSDLRRSEVFAPENQPKKRKKTEVDPPLQLEDFFNNWPSLRSALGYKLILRDFDSWYPDAGKLTEEKLDDLISKLSVRRENLCRQGKWREEMQHFRVSINSADTQNDSRTASKIRMLPYLQPPHGRANLNNKTCVIDVQNSIILQVKTADAVDGAIRKRAAELKKLKKTLQPIIVVVGADWSHIDEILCCVNEVKWKPDNLLSGIDLIFKTFFTLNLLYPYESEVIWGILQHFIYGMKKPNVHSEAWRVLKDLSKISETPQIEQQTIEDESDD